jgi:hypothetical protein
MGKIIEQGASSVKQVKGRACVPDVPARKRTDTGSVPFHTHIGDMRWYYFHMGAHEQRKFVMGKIRRDLK